MRNPLSNDVSVIMPTCRRPEVLQRSLRSVLAQTHSPFEVIVVDDGPDENTEAVVSSFADSRLRYLRTTGRIGAARARNLGVDASQSSWIAFNDDDDEWLLLRLQRQFEALQKLPDNTGFVCCSYLVLPRHEPPLVVSPTSRMNTGIWGPATLYSFPFITPTWLIRRDVFEEVGGFDAAMPNLEDWELAFRLHSHTLFHVISEPLVVKHGSHGSLDSNLPARLESFRRIHHKHEALWQNTPDVLAKIQVEIGKLCCRTSDFAAARSAAYAALRHEPFNATAWAIIAAASFAGLPYKALKGAKSE